MPSYDEGLHGATLRRNPFGGRFSPETDASAMIRMVPSAAISACRRRGPARCETMTGNVCARKTGFVSPAHRAFRQGKDLIPSPSTPPPR
jgi:hypothetical protein